MLDANSNPIRSTAHHHLRQNIVDGVKRATQELRSRTAVCPSCGTTSRLVFAGEQRWPEKLAEAAGMPSVVELWTCCNCGSTISHTDLE